MVDKILCLILGGGAGTRLYPLTKERSKPAVPVAGKYRLIDIPISNCLNSGIRQMYVITQYNSASLNQHIKNAYTFDHFNKGFIDILAAEQTPQSLDWFQGTADAVRQCLKHTRRYDFDYILILSGDQLYQMNLKKMGQFHVEKDADLTIATIPVNANDATGFGIMKVAEDQLIPRFIEKPAADKLAGWESPVNDKLKKEGRIYLASMGIYLFKKQILYKLLSKHPEAMDFGKEIIPATIKEKYVVGSYNYNGYWTDIGNIKSFFEANLSLTDNIPEFNLFDSNNHIYTNPRLLAPAKIINARMSHALIAEASIIHAELIERSVIGLRSRIGHQSIIKNTILFGNDNFETINYIRSQPEGFVPKGIGNNCFLENLIVEKDCRIGNNVTIIGDDSLTDCEEELYCIKDGIVVLKKGVTIPSGSKLGLLK